MSWFRGDDIFSFGGTLNLKSLCSIQGGVLGRQLKTSLKRRTHSNLEVVLVKGLVFEVNSDG